jgi:peptidoglycan/LPS O-acetylase OafA/YrhL
MPKTARTRHIRGIDGLRALAAFAVVAHHVGFDTGATFNSSFGAVLARLDIGVPIFFAISGYLLGRPFVSAVVERTSFSSFRSFWWRRIVRIYPAYWFVLTLLVLTAGIQVKSLYQFVVFYGLFQIYDKDLALKGMVQAWTLCTEVSFYAVLPLLALAARRLTRSLERPEARLKVLLAGCAGLYLLGVLWRLFLFTVDPPWGRAGLLWLPGQIDYFALGLAVAVVAVAAKRDEGVGARVARLVGRPGFWFLGAMAAFAVVCSIGLTRTVHPATVPLVLDGGELTRQFLYGIVAVLLLIPLALATRAVGSARVIFGTKVAAYLGLLSYGVYLWHKDLIPKAQLWAGDGLFQGNFVEIFVIVALASTFFAWLTYLFVEHPSLQWTRPRDVRDTTAWQRLVTTAAVARERMAAVGSRPAETEDAEREDAVPAVHTVDTVHTVEEVSEAPEAVGDGGQRRVGRWWLVIAAITVVGFGLRFAYFWFAQRNAYNCPPDQLLGCAGDGYVYHTSANLLADGRGFISPLGLLAGNVFPSADHPPFYIVYLAGFSKLGLDSYRWHQFATVLLGTLSMPVAGAIGVLLGRTLGDRGLRGLVGSPWLGAVTAGAVALSPAVWLNDGLLLSESTVVLTVLLAALAAIAFWRTPTTWRALLMGAACGLAALARAEAALLVPLVGFPLALLAVRRRPAPGRAPVEALGRRLALAGWVLLASLVVVAPWVVRNYTTFEKPTGLSTGLGVTMAYSNCDRTYYGDLVGFWWYDCKGDVDLQADVDQSVLDSRLRSQAIDYVKAHPARAPLVVAARAGRVWGVYHPNQVAYLETFEGRPLWAARASLLTLYPILALAVVAVGLLRRYRTIALPLLAPALVVTFAVMLTFGQPRYRATADGALAVLAGIGIARVVDVVRERRTARGTSEARPDRSESPPATAR